jgi:S-adenosylmethionine uptake transporter
MWKTNISKEKSGVILVLISTIFFGSYGIWAKMIGSSFDPFFQAWVRGIIVVSILLIVGLKYRKFRNIKRGDYKWFGIVTIIGSLVFPFYFIGFQNLNIGTATLLFYSSLTLVTYLVGMFFFDEKITSIKIFSLILGLIGLFIIFGFDIQKSELTSAIFSVLAGICGGIEISFSKKISSRYSAVQITTALYLVDFIINLFIFLMIGNQMSESFGDIQAWIGLFMFAIAGLLAFFFAVQGYEKIEPSMGGIIGLFEIIWAIIFGILLFEDELSIGIIAGSFLIIAAVAVYTKGLTLGGQTTNQSS